MNPANCSNWLLPPKHHFSTKKPPFQVAFLFLSASFRGARVWWRSWLRRLFWEFSFWGGDMSPYASLLGLAVPRYCLRPRRLAYGLISPLGRTIPVPTSLRSGAIGIPDSFGSCHFLLQRPCRRRKWALGVSWVQQLGNPQMLQGGALQGSLAALHTYKTIRKAPRCCTESTCRRWAGMRPLNESILQPAALSARRHRFRRMM